MPLVTSICLGKNEDGRLELVATSHDDDSSDTVWHAWQRTASGDWTGWHRFGKPASGALFSRPAAIQHAVDGRLEVFVIGGNDAVWHRWQLAKNDDWSPWSSLGKPEGQAVATSPASSLAVALLPDSRLAAFVVAGGAVWQTSQQQPLITTDWRRWSPLGQPGSGQAGDLALGVHPDGRLQLFTPELDHDGAVRGLWRRYQTEPMSEDWSDWKPLGRPAGQHQPFSPVVIAGSEGRLVVVTVASDGAVWHRSQQTDDPDAWAPWASLGRKEGGFWEVAGALDTTGRVVLVATTQSNNLWHSPQTSADEMTWVPWARLSTVPVPLAEETDPTLSALTLRKNSDGRMELFVVTWQGRPYQLRAIAPGDWGNPLGRLWPHP
jgi:hypothetical protein